MQYRQVLFFTSAVLFERRGLVGRKPHLGFSSTQITGTVVGGGVLVVAVVVVVVVVVESSNME
jgi:hypothetical protein